ncbi:hypothetical protein HAX54_036651, partial [Datura stramonium]|nr:hypothetical protein [Datura stramonium]
LTWLLEKLKMLLDLLCLLEHLKIKMLEHLILKKLDPNKPISKGIAWRLIKAALPVAAMKGEIRYPYLKKIERSVRSHFHNDITIVVVVSGSLFHDL